MAGEVKKGREERRAEFPLHLCVNPRCGRVIRWQAELCVICGAERSGAAAALPVRGRARR
jgi:hypothetical protein